MLAASGELLVFTDADGSYGPGEVERVVSALSHNPVVIGTRVHDRTTGTLGRRIASRVFNRTLRLLLRLPFRDTQCGLKGFRREVARELFGRARVDGFAFDVEVLLLARRLGLVVAEIPVRAQGTGRQQGAAVARRASHARGSLGGTSGGRLGGRYNARFGTGVF
jgi:dolichyl-phosphate beta-glucosyltransferase